MLKLGRDSLRSKAPRLVLGLGLQKHIEGNQVADMLRTVLSAQPLVSIIIIIIIIIIIKNKSGGVTT